MYSPKTDLFSSQKIIHGDCLEIMKGMEENSIDCVLTDPPYGISFMDKHWDKGIPGIEFWKEALRICKPGAIMLAFGGTRTYHRLACAIEDAGWQIRDCMQWVYGSGFPKSHNHFGFEGYGTALKPAYEPILLCMKPLDGTFAHNAEKWGVAGLNIDECRINFISEKDKESATFGSIKKYDDGGCYSLAGKSNVTTTHKNIKANNIGRWPANILFDEEAAAMLDEQSGISKSSDAQRNNKSRKGNSLGQEYNRIGFGHNDSGGASRFFYCAKASASERNKGCEGMELKENEDWPQSLDGNDKRVSNPRQNNHPTVKPVKLLEYLLKLIMPPSQDAVVLDPFMGSGSTLVAAKNLGFNAIGIEIEKDYCEIAEKRIS